MDGSNHVACGTRVKTEELRLSLRECDAVIQVRHFKYCCIINVQCVVETVFSNSFLP